MQNNFQQLILASSSPARKKLLARLQLPFICVSPDIDETPLPNETVQAMVVRLAEEKAKKVAAIYSDALIIGSDQVGVVDDMIMGKPLTLANAMTQLQAVSNNVCYFYTGLCLYNAARKFSHTTVVQTAVHYRHLSEATITRYLQKEDVLQCAGSIKSEGLAAALFERIVSDDPTALQGLPLITLAQLLEKEGVFV